MNGSLQFDTERLEPTFRFRKGAPGRSYGIAIARRLGLAAQVLAEAEQRIPTEERKLDGLLRAAEEREQRLAAQEAGLADRLAEAERAQARLGRAEEEQRVREGELRTREKDAERRARQESRRFLLEAREQVDAAVRAAAAANSEREATEARRRLEALIQEQGERLRELDELEPAAAPVPAGGLAVGQRVRLLTGGNGKVVELREDGLAVVEAGTLRIVAPVETLVVAVEQGRSGGQAVGRSGGQAVGRSATAAPAPSEIDLRGMRVDEALAATEAAVDAAVLADHPFLRIIHGMGTGAVREAVRRVLAADRRVIKFDFAPRQQGGTGVTVAELLK